MNPNNPLNVGRAKARQVGLSPDLLHLKQYGRWAFAEFTEVYQIEADFAKKVEAEFDKMIERATHEN